MLLLQVAQSDADIFFAVLKEALVGLTVISCAGGIFMGLFKLLLKPYKILVENNTEVMKDIKSMIQATNEEVAKEKARNDQQDKALAEMQTVQHMNGCDTPRRS